MNQTKLPLMLGKAIQEMGNQARCVKIGGKGPNALDFHIACYAGQIVKHMRRRGLIAIDTDKICYEHPLSQP